MLALLPHFSMPESVVKQLTGRVCAVGVNASQGEVDEIEEVVHLFQGVAANITAYCRSLIANIGEC